MKYLKLAIFLIFLAINALAFADDFTLTINNNTEDSFILTSAPPRPLANLNPGEQNKAYSLGFMPWAKKFVLLLTSNTAQKASVIYDSPTIFCNPQTAYYRCSFSNLTQDSAILTLTKR